MAGESTPRFRDILELPDGVADPEVARWLSAFAEVRRDTDKILDQIRPEAIDADLGDGGDTLGTVLYHAALVEMSWVFLDILDREADIPKALFPHDDRVVDGRLTPVLGETLEQHRRAARPGARDRLAGAGVDVERGVPSRPHRAGLGGLGLLGRVPPDRPRGGASGPDVGDPGRVPEVARFGRGRSNSETRSRGQQDDDETDQLLAAE